jgi:hypothetical protein
MSDPFDLQRFLDAQELSIRESLPKRQSSCDELIAKFAEGFRGPCCSAQFWRYV